MNIRLFSIFIIALGIIIFAIGGMRIIANPYPRGRMGMGTYELESFRRRMNEKRNKRDSGKMLMLSGGIVAFIGVAMRVSAKKPE